MSVEEPIRRIAKPPADYDAFLRVAGENGWEHVRTEQQRPNHPLYCQEIYTDPAKQLGVYYIEDDYAGVVWVAAGGPTEKRAIASLEKGMPLYSEQELLTTFDEAKSDEELAQAAVRIGVAAPKTPNPEYVRRLAAALSHPHPGVRAAALVATSYKTWDELKPMVQELYERETAEDPKRKAAKLLALWEKKDAGEL